MTVIKTNSGLEDFVERHQADFDAFEPRPDLWDAIEARLDAPDETAAPTPTPVVPLHPAAPTAPKPAFVGWQRYAAAAAVAALLLGGLGLRRATDQPIPADSVATVTPTLDDQPEAVTAFFGSPAPMTVSAGSPAERMGLEVRRMEAYYASQLQEKEHELRLLDAAAETGAAPKADDWKHELTGLDSTYRQLRAELQRNPDPTAVLEAMNRNLQIRLDILNQQLRTREQIQQLHDESYITAAARQ